MTAVGAPPVGAAGPGWAGAGAVAVGVVIAAPDVVGATGAGLVAVVGVDEAAEAAVHLAQVEVAARRRRVGVARPLVLVLHLAQAAAPEGVGRRVGEEEEVVDVAKGLDVAPTRLARHVAVRAVLAARGAADLTEAKGAGRVAHAEAGVHRPVAANEVAVGRVPRGARLEVRAVAVRPQDLLRGVA